ncbi:hypothetical protein XANCAGTX0491_005844 [Xanthoria calcicola]
MPLPSPNPFLLLSLAGFCLLWVNMYLNNTIDALDLTTKTGMFPNGRTLLNSFTGWTRLDLNMATLVCFFDGMTDGSDPGTKLLYMDVVGTLHTAILWFMLQILRAPKPQSISLLLPAFWALLWNGLGAGWILPLGIYFHLQSPTSSTTPTQTIPLPHAKALLPTMTITSYLTAAIMFLSPVLTTSTLQHQTLLAWFQLAPLSTAILQTALAASIAIFLPPHHQTVDHEIHESRTLTRTSLLLSALFSASIHLYCLLTTLLSSPLSSPLTTFPRVYIPAPTSVHPNAADIIAQGAALFMRYDNIIINATCALLCYMVMSPHLDLGAQQGSKMGLAVGIAVATFLMGPGAVGSLGFWWREGEGCDEEGLDGEEKSMRG